MIISNMSYEFGNYNLYSGMYSKKSKAVKNESKKPLSIDELRKLSSLQLQNEMTKNYVVERNRFNQEEIKTPLQESLEKMREAIKRNEEQKKQEEISKKIAKGKASMQEEAYLAEKNPELHQKAVIARDNTNRVRASVKAAKTKEEAKRILAQADSSAGAILDKDKILGELMIEGLKEVEKEYQEGKLGKKRSEIKEKKHLDELA